MQLHIPYVQIVELIATVAAFVYIRKDSENPWPWFKWFLLFVFLVESSGYTYRLIQVLQGAEPKKNYFFYKINLPVEILFHSWVLFIFTKQYKNLNSYYLFGIVAFFCLFILELLQEPQNKYVVKTDLYETLFLLTGCLLYYYYFLKQEHHVEVIKFAPFWIVTGMFFYHFIGFCTTAFFEYLALINESPKGFPLRRYVFMVLLTVFYGSWVYAFKIRRKHLT